MEGAVDETTMRREARGGEEERDERAWQHRAHKVADMTGEALGTLFKCSRPRGRQRVFLSPFAAGAD